MIKHWTIFALTVATIGAQTHGYRRGSASRSVQPAPPAINAADLSNADQPQLALNDKGPGVVRAEILLARAHFSCGQIDGTFGSNLQKALVAFQSDRNIPTSGILDPPTWSALNADQAPPLINYTIAPDDLKGPLVHVPADMMQQAKLPYLGYASPLDELAERFHSSQDLMKQLNPGADFGKAGQQIQAPNVLMMPPAIAAPGASVPAGSEKTAGSGSNVTVVVSKSESSVRLYGPENKLLAFYVATIGSEHDPLPIGDWKINGVKFNPVFHYNAELFWNAPDKSEKAEIKPGPRNPVGLVWMDLSKEHYGIHGTPDPSTIGHTSSHGCIRLTNWDAVELATMVHPGTPAILKE